MRRFGHTAKPGKSRPAVLRVWLQTPNGALVVIAFGFSLLWKVRWEYSTRVVATSTAGSFMKKYRTMTRAVALNIG